MPYAVFSKRTKIISRIVHELSALLPSESSIEVTDDISFPHSIKANVIGQRINTNGLRLFDSGGGVPTIKPYHRVYNAADRVTHVKYAPMFTNPVDINGDNVEEFVDVPIYVDPFSWKAGELAQVKYESILAENYPYQVAIGEEFITDDHISSSSADYVLSEGQCMLQPGGILQTEEYKFFMPKRVASTATKYGAMRYVFDTFYFSTEPEFPEGVIVTWNGTKADGSGATGWEEVVTDAERPTILAAAPTVLVPLAGITLKIQNLTGSTFEIENYMLFLRARTATQATV